MTSSSTVSDVDLKFRTKRLFWSLGAYCRIEVDLAGVEFRQSFKRVQFTDIDVLGVHIGGDLSMEYYLADCKAGKNISAAERTLWLKGVMSLFSMSKGYLVKQSIASNARLLAKKLGIKALDDNDLLRLESNLGLAQLDAAMFKPSEYFRVKTELHKLEDDLHPLYKYMKYRYWIEPNHRNIATLLALGRRLSKAMQPSSVAHQALVYDLLTLLALSLLEIAAYLFSAEANSIPQAVRTYLAGGSTEYETRRQLIERIQTLVSATNSSAQPRLEVDPPYLSDLCDTINMLANKPIDASEVPRYIDAVLYEVVLGGATNLQRLFPSPNKMALKLAKDIAALTVRQTGISSLFVEPLNKQ